jgi:lipoate-protein ligase A
MTLSELGAPWRLIVHDRVDGALNMAIDRAMQVSRHAGSTPPTLRLYRWARPTVTLGRFQKTHDVDLEYCRSQGIDVVRRFTGGRGVLHDDELTYCVVASVDDGVPRGTADSYAHLCAALIHTYGFLGIGAVLTARDRGDTTSGACYLQTSRADLSCGPAKLAGSAQVWLGSTVMQHGSITLSRDIERERRVFRLSAEQTDRLGSHTLTATDALSSPPDLDHLVAACIAGFERALGVSLKRGGLTAFEGERVALIGASGLVGPDAPHLRA